MAWVSCSTAAPERRSYRAVVHRIMEKRLRVGVRDLRGAIGGAPYGRAVLSPKGRELSIG